MTISKQIGTDNSGFNADADENSNWVEHIQNAMYQNLVLRIIIFAHAINILKMQNAL